MLMAAYKAGERGISWDGVAAALWPDGGVSKRDRSCGMRQTLVKLRRALASGKIPIEIETVPRSGIVCYGQMTVVA